MARCSALVCTAGFESVCEALYFSKPVMLIPVEGHFEQYCNARDTARIGAGVYSKHFDFDPAVIQQLQQTLPGETYKVWVDQFPEDLKSVIAGMTRERVWKYESVNTTPSH
jgi:UDP:flavonoid glycosyltransferase YjiC (YdhE family)